MVFSTEELTTLAVLPKISGGISFFFCVALVGHILWHPEKRSSFYHRIILGMASDMGVSKQAR